MAVRSTQCQNRAVRSTQGGRGCHPHILTWTLQSEKASPGSSLLLYKELAELRATPAFQNAEICEL